MDKYEFKLKIDQLKKLIHEEDYNTALRIVQAIDWNRVRNANLLTMAASVYERTDHLQEAKDMLILAFERAPVGKHILYKLTELSCRTGDLEEAEDYYREFRSVDSTDISNYILQYMILKARHAPYERQLLPLERYCELDPDEKWLYELACAYEYDGRISDCVRTCDKLALLYGSSSYSVKGLRLKARYTQLTDVQKNIVSPRTVPQEEIRYEEPEYDEAGLRGGKKDNAEKESTVSEAVPEDRGFMPEEQSLSSVTAGIYDDRGYRYSIEDAPAAEERDIPSEDELAADKEKMQKYSDELAAVRYADEDAAFDAYVRAYGNDGIRDAVSTSSEDREEQLPDGDGVQMTLDFGGGEPVIVSEKAEAKVGEVTADTGAVKADAERSVQPEEAQAAEAAASEKVIMPDAAAISGSTPIESAAANRQIPKEIQMKETAVSQSREPVTQKRTAEEPQSQSQPQPQHTEPVGFHMIVEAESAAEGLSIAVDELKNIHEENGIEHASVKTTAEKLNLRGLSESVLEKVRGKDFVIENAGSLSEENLRIIRDFILGDGSNAIVVLIDTPDGLDRIEDLMPELFDICDYVSDEADEESGQSEAAESSRKPEAAAARSGQEAGGKIREAEAVSSAPAEYEEEAADDGPYEEETEEERPYEEKKEPVKRSNGKVKPERFYNIKDVVPSAPDHQMEIEEFAQYCAQYAAEIDCSITGTSMLALYERIELMEEDGIPLTKTNAEQLIEEAADRAEKPPLGKRITGMFHSKYDKNGLLILKEEDFVF